MPDDPTTPAPAQAETIEDAPAEVWAEIEEQIDTDLSEWGDELESWMLEANTKDEQLHKASAAPPQHLVFGWGLVPEPVRVDSNVFLQELRKGLAPFGDVDDDEFDEIVKAASVAAREATPPPVYELSEAGDIIAKSSKVDTQGDVISMDEVERAAYDFVMDSREAEDMHSRSQTGAAAVGTLVESVVFTDEKLLKMGIPEELHSLFPRGWWVGFKVTPEEFALVQGGSRTMFSIAGRGKRTAIE